MLSKSSIEFLDELKENNNREWFLANKKRYDVFKNDYHQLVGLFLEQMKPFDVSLEMLEIKNCTFRINRDIRFSNNKSPYKTHLGVWLSSGSKNSNRSGYYIHIERDASFIAGGLYAPESEDLKKVRKEIAYFYEDLEAILNDKDFSETFEPFNRTEKSVLKNPPRGFEKEHPAIELLKLKSFEVIHKIDIELITKQDFVETTVQKLKLLKPLNDFMNRALETA